MSKITFKPVVFWLICAILVGVVFIIHSCKKDNKPAAIADPAINQAKEWYEATYSTIPTVRFALKVSGNTRSSGNSRFDYSKHIKPDWQHGTKYNRYNSDVIELPLDPSSDKINSGFKNMSTGKMVYKPQYSRSSFLLLHDGTGYRAYVMTILGDSAYINNDPSKLALTTYRKRDPNFSGMVAYFTPDGKFVASFGYKDGKLIPATLPATASSAAANTKSTARFHPTARKLAVTNCIDWYMCYFENDVIVEADYLYTTCDVVDDGSGGSTGGGTSPAPAPCPSSAPSPANSATTHTPHAMIRVAAPSPTPIGDDGGLPPPPPPTQTTETCPVVVTTTVIDTTKDPCAQATALARNQGFINRMDSLQTLKNTTGETDYLMMPNGIFKKQTNTVNGGNFQFSTTYFNGSSGFIHNHGTGPGILSVFSSADLATLFAIITQGNASNPSTFTFGMVNQNGQSYLVTISNMTNFLTWGNTYTSNGQPTGVFDNLYNNFIKSTNSDTVNEGGLVNFLNLTNSGLTLMKGNTTNTSWSTVVQNSDGTYSIVQCQ